MAPRPRRRICQDSRWRDAADLLADGRQQGSASDMDQACRAIDGSFQRYVLADY
jgi:hypothetical protein